MILLDTNVVSEWMRPRPNPRVLAWLDDQRRDRLFLCAVTRAEIETGLLSEGQRKTALRSAAHIVFQEFAQRCLALDCDCATRYADVLAESRRMGRPISVEDAQIAAIALHRGCELATRNVADFEFLGRLSLTNPWEHEPA
jgi:predicted nucleic acid-binding protein